MRVQPKTIQTYEKKKDYSAHFGLFIFAVGLRAITAFIISLASGVSLPNLALFYDGHIFMIIAKTFPIVYSGFEVFFPNDNPCFITNSFPIYPAFIRLLSLFTGDLRFSALITAWLAGGIAVVLFYELAKDYLKKPLLPAILFSFLPTAWLIDGSLALVESTYVCMMLACILTLQRGKYGWAVLFAALTVISQKSGFLLLPILVFSAKPRRRALLPCISAIGALAALQLYLWWLFGDPLINIRMAKFAYSQGNDSFGFPFVHFIKWMFDPTHLFRGMFWQRKIVIVLEMTFYVGVLTWALLRYSPEVTVFIVWLGITLVFNASLAGHWSFYGFPRYMSMAGPAAIILTCYLFPVGEGRWRWASVGLLLCLTMVWTVLDALGAIDACFRLRTVDYFIAIVDAIKL